MYEIQGQAGRCIGSTGLGAFASPARVRPASDDIWGRKQGRNDNISCRACPVLFILDLMNSLKGWKVRLEVHKQHWL